MASSSTTRRRFLAALGTAVPALAVAPTKGWALANGETATLPSRGLWSVLEHVTDGTDPSTSVIAQPHFTQEIRNLAGAPVELSGYLQPLSVGFGDQKAYLLSRGVFHCPYCYAFGRGSLATVMLASHASVAFDKRVTVRGELALQDRDPADFYFQLKNAQIIS